MKNLLLCSQRISLTLLLALFSSAFVHAADRYVDPLARGANDGTSWANAWTSFSSVNWAQVGASGTLWVSGGATSQSYSGGFTVGAGGASDTSRLTVRIGQDAGHNGRALFSGDIIANGRSFVTIDGLYAGARNFDLTNSAVQIQNTTSVTIQGMEIHGPGASILGQYSNAGVRISNNYLYNISADAAISMANPAQPVGYDRQLIDHNTIQVNRDSAGSGGGSDGIQGSWGLTIANNTFQNAIGTTNSTQHQDFIQMQANYVTIRNNTFLHSADSMIDYDTYNGQPHHHRIFNNVFIINRGAGIRYYNSGGSSFTSIDNILIANNTFVNHISGHQWSLSFQFFTGTVNPTVTNTAIRNNIFYDDIDPVHIEASSNATQANWNFDYNLINAGPSGTTSVVLDGSSYAQAHARTGVPSFVSWVENPTNFANNNFTMPDLHLQSTDTAAKDLAMTIAEFTDDKDSVARPQGVAWDTGAYEYQTGVSQLAPPSNLSVVVR